MLYALLVAVVLCRILYRILRRPGGCAGFLPAWDGAYAAQCVWYAPRLLPVSR